MKIPPINLSKLSLTLLLTVSFTAVPMLEANAQAPEANPETPEASPQTPESPQAPEAAPMQVPQTTTALTERSDYVGVCRTTNATSVTLYEDSRLTRASGIVPANSKVTLTGVLGNNIAQIKTPLVGWVQSANLRVICGDDNSGGNPVRGECRRLRDPDVDGALYEDLRYGLRAYDNPGSGLQTHLGNPDGPAKGARVFLTQPTQINNRWVRSFYNGRSGSERLGWISLGTGTRNNLAYCL